MTETIPAARFKATCLDLLDRVAAHKVDEVAITKHGRIVGILRPPPQSQSAIEGLFGCMRGFTRVADDVDLTAPVLEGEPLAAKGLLHG